MSPNWSCERARFQAMGQAEKLAWGMRLMHDITVSARSTYRFGEDGVENPAKLRRYNEFLHRVAGIVLNLSKECDDDFCYANFFAALEAEASSLGIADWLLERVSTPSPGKD